MKLPSGIRAALAATLFASAWPGVASADPLEWRDFKTEACSGWGTRQYAARLMNIPDGISWEDSCNATPAQVTDRQGTVHRFAKPSRCNKFLSSEMWGEFDVPDAQCVARWGPFKADACQGIRLRQYSSVLEDIPPRITWKDACFATPGRIRTLSGIELLRARPDRCPDRVALGPQWGEFELPADECAYTADQFVSAMQLGGIPFTETCLRDVFASNNPADPQAVGYRTDGCSVPVGDPDSIAYKDLFFGACVVHDTCNTLPWPDGADGKTKCEGAMHKQMTASCDAKGKGGDCYAAAAIWVSIAGLSAQGAAAFRSGQDWRQNHKVASCSAK